MKHGIRRAILALGFLLAVILSANIPVSIQVGVNGQYRSVSMPLYVKWTQFLARHYEYERLSKEITAGCKTEEEKALAILKWTKDHLKDVPPGMPICDDHVLYIIIRGYAVPEQFQDVFTTLCAYAGMPAFFDRCHDKEHKSAYDLSYVKMSGKWRVFDAYYGKYFRNDDGEIAAVEDILENPGLVRGGGIEQIFIGTAPYRDFFFNLSLAQVDRGVTLRPYRQMLFRRIVYEMRKGIGLEKNYGL